MSIIANMLGRIGKLEATVKAQKPQSGPGIHVSQTPRGVIIKTSQKESPPVKSSGTSVPTWG